MKSFSMDLRRRVAEFVGAGHSKAEAARHFQVSYGFVKKLFARLKLHGTWEPGRAPGPRPKLNPEQQEQLAALVRKQPDATLKELRDQLAEVCGVRLSISGVDVWVKRLDLSFKKVAACRRTGSQGRCPGARTVAAEPAPPGPQAADFRR